MKYFSTFRYMNFQDKCLLHLWLLFSFNIQTHFFKIDCAFDYTYLYFLWLSTVVVIYLMSVSISFCCDTPPPLKNSTSSPQLWWWKITQLELVLTPQTQPFSTVSNCFNLAFSAHYSKQSSEIFLARCWSQSMPQSYDCVLTIIWLCQSLIVVITTIWPQS